MTRRESPQVTFRCSFGGESGWGHVVRSSALASSFQRAGWRTELWTESDSKTLPGLVKACFERIGSARSQDASVLVVDEMYTPDEEFATLASEWRAGAGAVFLVGIDDMQRRRMGAFDAVVNTELGLDVSEYVPKIQLLGERYALLRDGFANPARIELWPKLEQRLPVLAMIGGTDAFSYTSRALAELWRWRGDAVAPVVVMGSGSAAKSMAVAEIARFSEGRLLEGLDASQLGSWMRQCAFAVVACGSSVYELAAMQLPFIGLSLVDNQSATAAKIESLWRLPIVYRENRHDDPLDIQRELEAIASRGKAAYSEVDTKGADRVRDVILASLEIG